MDPQQVALIITSLNEGFNGDVPNKQIRTTIREDGVIEYGLAEWDPDVERFTGRVEHYEVTVTPVSVTEPPAE